MPDLDLPAVFQVSLGQDLVDLGQQGRFFLELMVDLVQDDIAGTAGGDDVQAPLGLGNGQIAGGQDIHRELVAAHIGDTGAAAVPILDLL